VVLSDESFKELVGHDADAPNVVIMSVAVDPAHQGRGNSTLMMQAFVERMRRMGKTSIHLMCKERHAIQAAWILLRQALGFRPQRAWHEMVMDL